MTVSKKAAWNSLLTPVKLGAFNLPNRVVMAPMTRCRADPVTLVPTKMMAKYYAQRASAGLILTEGSVVCPSGIGYPAVPGIWTQDQVNGWKLVTDAVHKAGGRILLQLWHTGRITDPDTYLDGKSALSASPIAASGDVSLLQPKRPHPVPKEMTVFEIAEIVRYFRQGAVNAKKANFDGVDIHAANGYLIDQFLEDKCNKRTDKYGGTIENRARFLLEIVDAVGDVLGYDHISVHLSPRGDLLDMGDSDPKALFTYVARELGKRGIAFIFLREHLGPDSLAREIKQAFNGPVVINEGMGISTAAQLVGSGQFDAVGFGTDYVANPDFVDRIQLDEKFNEPDFMTFFGGDAHGFINYPSLKQLNLEADTDGVKFFQRSQEDQDKMMEQRAMAKRGAAAN